MNKKDHYSETQKHDLKDAERLDVIETNGRCNCDESKRMIDDVATSSEKIKIERIGNMDTRQR